MNLTELCGNGCGTRYEKEYQNKFRDCITFYFDGKVLFERFCWQPIRELKHDSQNGYSPLRLLLRRLCKR